MNSTNQEVEEAEILKVILQKINELELEDTESISTSLYENQPIILSMMMVYESNVDEGLLEQEQFDVIRDMLFMIYLFFDHTTNIKRKQVTEIEIKKQFQLNVEFMEYLLGEDDPESQLELKEADLDKMQFKNLYNSITYIANDNDSFKKIEEQNKATVFLEMKTLIESMEGCLIEK